MQIFAWKLHVDCFIRCVSSTPGRKVSFALKTGNSGFSVFLRILPEITPAQPHSVVPFPQPLCIYCALKQLNLSPEEVEMSVKTERDVVVEGTPTEFVSLEEKIYRTIELLKNAREGKAAVERDLARVKEQLEAREEEIESLKTEAIALRREREEVKSRVEKMLEQMDTIIAAQ